MKMLHQRAFCLLILLLALGPGALSKEPEQLTKKRAIYLREVQKIDAEYQAEVKAASQKYVDNLAKAKSYYAKKADLDTVLIIKAEIDGGKKALADGKLVTPGKLVKLRGTHAGDLGKLKSTRDASVVKLTQRYVKELDKVQAFYTRREEIEEAVAVKNEIDGLKQLLQNGSAGPGAGGPSGPRTRPGNKTAKNMNLKDVYKELQAEKRGFKLTEEVSDQVRGTDSKGVRYTPSFLAASDL